ncbi:unnamed protein product [Peniophora sp. CBMAI 1063]|nr:unnamed protein product [Peniophora sp. CBMAI 1063]
MPCGSPFSFARLLTFTAPWPTQHDIPKIDPSSSTPLFDFFKLYANNRHGFLYNPSAPATSEFQRLLTGPRRRQPQLSPQASGARRGSRGV